MAYGIGGFGEGFLGGFEAGDRIQQRRAESKRQDDKNARDQQVHDRTENDKVVMRDATDKLVALQQRFLGEQSGQEGPPPPGIQQQPVGPPEASGAPPAAPMPQPGVQQPGAAPMPTQGAPAQTRRAMGYMDALDDSFKYMKEATPLYMKILSIASPEKAAAYAEKLGDAKVQQSIAEEVAVGRLLLNNPNSEEAKQALMRFYDRIPDGRQVDPNGYEVLGNGSLKFYTFDPKDPQGSRKPELLAPAQIRGMAMRNMTAAQLSSHLAASDKNVIDKDYKDAQVANMAEDNTRARQQHGAIMADRAEARRDRAEERGIIRQDRATAAQGRERDEVVKGMSAMIYGDEKVFSQLPPEQQQEAHKMGADAMALVEMNEMGKGQSAGRKAADLIKLIASGQAQIVKSKTDPALSYAIVGGQQFKIPSGAFAVQRASGAGPKEEPKKQSWGI